MFTLFSKQGGDSRAAGTIPGRPPTQSPPPRPEDAAVRGIMRDLEVVFRIRGRERLGVEETEEERERREEEEREDDARVMEAALSLRERYTSEEGLENEDDREARLDERRRRILSEISNTGALNRAFNRSIALLRQSRGARLRRRALDSSAGEEESGRDVFLQTVLELLIDAVNAGNASRILLHSGGITAASAATSSTAGGGGGGTTTRQPTLERDEPKDVVEGLMEILRGDSRSHEGGAREGNERRSRRDVDDDALPPTTNRWVTMCAIQALECLMRELPDQTSDRLLRVPASLETCVGILNLDETVADVEVKREMIAFLEMLTRTNPQAKLFVAFCDGLEAVMRLAMIFQRDRRLRRLAVKIVLNTVEDNPKGKRLLCDNPHLVRSLCGMVEEGGQEEDEEDDLLYESEINNHNLTTNGTENEEQFLPEEDACVTAIRVFRCVMMKSSSLESHMRFSHFDRYVNWKKNNRHQRLGEDDEQIASKCAASLLSIRGKGGARRSTAEDDAAATIPIVVMSLQHCAGANAPPPVSPSRARLSARFLERRREATRALGEVLRWDAVLSDKTGSSSYRVFFERSLRIVTSSVVDEPRWIDVEPLAYLWWNLTTCLVANPPRDDDDDPMVEIFRRAVVPNASEYEVEEEEGGGEDVAKNSKDNVIAWLGQELVESCEAVRAIHNAVYVEAGKILELRTRIYRRFRLWEMLLVSPPRSSPSKGSALMRRELVTKIVMPRGEGGTTVFARLFSGNEGELKALLSQFPGENESGAVRACRAMCVKELLRCLCVWCGGVDEDVLVKTKTIPAVAAKKFGALDLLTRRSDIIRDDAEYEFLMGLARCVLSEGAGGDEELRMPIEERRENEWIDDECLSDALEGEIGANLLRTARRYANAKVGNGTSAPKPREAAPPSLSTIAVETLNDERNNDHEEKSTQKNTSRESEEKYRELDFKYRQLLDVVAKQEIERALLTEALMEVGGEGKVREVERRLGSIMSSSKIGGGR